jgi:hypothetical protein
LNDDADDSELGRQFRDYVARAASEEKNRYAEYKAKQNSLATTEESCASEPPTRASQVCSHEACTKRALQKARVVVACAPEVPEVGDDSACELPSWQLDSPDAPQRLELDQACDMPSSKRKRPVPARHVLDNIMAAILSSPILEQPMVVSTGAVDGGFVLLDGCCPRAGFDARLDRHDHDRKSIWMHRLQTSHVKGPIADASDIIVSNDAYSVACLLMKR